MISPLTIKEKALADLQYLSNENTKITSRLANKIQWIQRLEFISIAAAAIFSCLAVVNAVHSITRKSITPLRLAAGWGSGAIFAAAFGLYYLDPYFLKLCDLQFHLNFFSRTINNLANGWKSATIPALSSKTSSWIEAFLLPNEQLDALIGLSLFSFFPDKDKITAALTNVLVVQLAFDLLRLPEEEKRVNKVRDYLPLSSLPFEAAKRIEKIADFIEKNPGFILKEPYLSSLDTFDVGHLRETH